jgi:hypothetical protein
MGGGIGIGSAAAGEAVVRLRANRAMKMRVSKVSFFFMSGYLQ